MKMRVTIEYEVAAKSEENPRDYPSWVSTYQQLVTAEGPEELIADIAGVVNGLLETQQK